MFQASIVNANIISKIPVYQGGYKLITFFQANIFKKTVQTTITIIIK